MLEPIITEEIANLAKKKVSMQWLQKKGIWGVGTEKVGEGYGLMVHAESSHAALPQFVDVEYEQQTYRVPVVTEPSGPIVKYSS
jgi:hypothetical protein